MKFNVVFSLFLVDDERVIDEGILKKIFCFKVKRVEA